MRPEQWDTFKRAARGEAFPRTPLALIIDSPWLPGYAGVSHLDYYLDPECWFQVNLRFAREFPEVIPVPSWWVEYGMAIEPSVFGNRIHFFSDRTPGQTPILTRLADAVRWPPINPYTDGLMAFALHLYRLQQPRIHKAGFITPLVTARGPLCLASFLRGVTEFMTDLTEDPEGVHRLLDAATAAIIRWLEAQAETLGNDVEGLFLLDDIPGMLSGRMYLEFAHPYLQRICAAFPQSWVKIYHNDANIRPFLSELGACGFQVLNWTHNIGIEEARSKLGEHICLMGNVPPLDLGVRGTPEQVRQAAVRLIESAGGRYFILSVGGGVSPGMSRENIQALIEAAAQGAPAPLRSA
ncbi:MAG: uroporphyrinogen decarboxylase family protein [Bryobacteraceae bacterium]